MPLPGRERPFALALALLRCDDLRLLTITGASGIGKTCLAMEIARAALPPHADGMVLARVAERPLKEVTRHSF